VRKTQFAEKMDAEFFLGRFQEIVFLSPASEHSENEAQKEFSSRFKLNRTLTFFV
jgi:hypothetical protein